MFTRIMSALNLAHFAIYKVLSGRNIFVNRNVCVFLPANDCVVTLVLANFFHYCEMFCLHHIDFNHFVGWSPKLEDAG